MSKWQSTTLHNKIHIKHGFPFKGEFFTDSGDHIVLTPGNFYEQGGFKRQDGKEKFYSGSIPESYIHKKGDLIVAMTEQTPGLLGSCAIVPENNLYLHNQRLGLITVNDQQIDKMFIYHLFKTKSVREQIRLTSTGSKVKHTAPDRIYDVSVNLPPKPIQEKIAHALSVIENKIDLNNRINAELEAMAKALYDYWFVQFDFPDENGKPYKSSGGKMEYNPTLKRNIPKGWECKAIPDLLTIRTGKEDANFASEKGIYPFFTCGEEMLYCDIAVFSGKAILLAGNGNFAVRVYDGEFNAYQRTYVLIPENEHYYSVVYYAVRDKIKTLTKGSRGSIIKFITKGDIEDIKLALPEEGLLLNCFEMLNNVAEKISINNKENQQLTQLRDWLLPMLMNGQVKITDSDQAQETSSAA